MFRVHLELIAVFLDDARDSSRSAAARFRSVPAEGRCEPSETICKEHLGLEAKSETQKSVEIQVDFQNIKIWYLPYHLK